MYSSDINKFRIQKGLQWDAHSSLWHRKGQECFINKLILAGENKCPPLLQPGTGWLVEIPLMNSMELEVQPCMELQNNSGRVRGERRLEFVGKDGII